MDERVGCEQLGRDNLSPQFFLKTVIDSGRYYGTLLVTLRFRMNIFDNYSPYQLRQIFLEKNWPEDFRNMIHEEIAYELLNSWLESVDNESYNERVRQIVENLTYGYEDENGKEMLDFNP